MVCFASKNNRWEFIDLLKGIAISMVILTHSHQRFFELNINIKRYLSYGEMGCQLFFLCSGFMLCRSYKKRNVTASEFSLMNIKRIIPLWWVSLLVYCTISIITNEKDIKLCFSSLLNWKAIVCNVFMVHAFFPQWSNVIVPGGWFVGVMVVFYIMFPYLIFIYDKLNRSMFIFSVPIVACLLSTLSFFVLKKGGIVNPDGMFIRAIYYGTFLNQLASFLVGVSLYYYVSKGLKMKEQSWIIVFFETVLLVLISYKLYCMNNTTTIKPLMATISYLPLFIKLYRVEIRNNLNLVKNNILSLMGKKSYAILFVHFFFAWYMIDFIKNITINLEYYSDNLLWGVLIIPIFAMSIVFAVLYEAVSIRIINCVIFRINRMISRNLD